MMQLETVAHSVPGYLLLHAEITVIELKVFIGVSVHLYLKYYQPNPGAALDSSHQAQNHHHLICPAVSAQVLWVSKYENYMRVHDIDSRLIPCNVETPAAVAYYHTFLTAIYDNLQYRSTDNSRHCTV